MMPYSFPLFAPPNYIFYCKQSAVQSGIDSKSLATMLPACSAAFHLLSFLSLPTPLPFSETAFYPTNTQLSNLRWLDYYTSVKHVPFTERNPTPVIVREPSMTTTLIDRVCVKGNETGPHTSPAVSRLIANRMQRLTEIKIASGVTVFSSS